MRYRFTRSRFYLDNGFQEVSFFRKDAVIRMRNSEKKFLDATIQTGFISLYLIFREVNMKVVYLNIRSPY
jgi:hypothetical protein